jgi:integrase
MPRLGDLLIADIDKNILDKTMIWPLQKVLAKSSVVKKFHILKAAAKKAFNLDLLVNNPLAGFKISDFGDFSEDDKESKLKPRMVPVLLDEMQQQPLVIKMICMLMLSLGTRIGETLLAKWSNFNLTFDPAWDIPKQDTKTKSPITIHLPPQLTEMLIQWKAHQKQCRYKGKWLFPNADGKNSINYEKVRKSIQGFSASEWHSHDLRKCARICWEENGVDGLVAERMLNHTLGKTTSAYTGKAYSQRKQALIEHTKWLSQQNKNCFILNPESTPS